GALGPLADQPLLAGLLLGAVFPALESTHAQKTEPRGDGLSVGPVAEGDGLKLLGRQAREKLLDALGLAVGAQSCSRPTCLARALRQCEGGFRREHARRLVDREHVLEASVIEISSQLGVRAVGLIPQDRRTLDIPLAGAFDQLLAELGLGLELDLVG